MKKNKKLMWALIIILACIAIFKPSMKTAGCTTPNCVDFGTTDGTITMDYGTNEADEWDEFASSSTFQQYTKDVKTKYIRTWLSATTYRPSTFPLSSSGTYTWTNVDKFVDAVIATGATPFILFAHGDRCNSDTPFDFGNCQAHGVKAPSDNTAFGNYAATVVQHFVDRYGYSFVNTWYFEILNEPYGWSDYSPYWSLFQVAEPRIKAIVPGAKVGGGAYGGISGAVNAGFDFIDSHMYPENSGYGCDWVDTVDQADDCDQEVMDGVTNIMYTTPINTKSQIGSIEFINGEYHMSVGNPVDAERPFIGSYMAAAWLNMIKSKVVRMELTYSGGCGANNLDGADGCMGLWRVTTNKLLSAYDMKKEFTALNPTGSTIYANTDDAEYDILAVQSNGIKYITVVRKKSTTGTLSLSVLGTTATKLVNTKTAAEHSISGGSVSLSFQPYEVKFLKVSEGTCTPETDTTFCSRLSKQCGSVTNNDNCGTSRTVNCGSCTSPATCVSNQCVTSCTYSAWSTCSASCTQTRTVLTGSGCSGPLSQSCTGGSCVSNQYDINNDGFANCADFFLVIDCNGQPISGQCAKADINSDSAINSLDMQSYRTSGNCLFTSYDYITTVINRFRSGTTTFSTFISNANTWVSS